MQASYRPSRAAWRAAPSSVAIISGGLDSTVLVYNMLREGMTPHLLSFDYGQRHRKELFFARGTAMELLLPHDIIDLTSITHLIGSSALTSPMDPIAEDNFAALKAAGPPYPEAEPLRPLIEVPDGHYAEESMKATVVPNRNMIMLSIAVGVAVSMKAQHVGVGIHSGDHFIYPDCRPAFIKAMDTAVSVANEGFDSFDWGTPDSSAFYTPFINLSKTDIAYEAIKLGVPVNKTWSCYKGGAKHCGRCGTCVERLEAIRDASLAWNDHQEAGAPLWIDMTEYEDSQYWLTKTRS